MHMRDIMTTDVVTITSNTSIIKAKRIMDKNRLKRLPVLDDGKLVGIRPDTANTLGILCRLGEHAPEMIKGAVTSGFPPDRAVVVNSHEEMGKKIKEIMKDGDLILLKGSRGMALEKVSKNLNNSSIAIT